MDDIGVKYNQGTRAWYTMTLQLSSVSFVWRWYFELRVEFSCRYAETKYRFSDKIEQTVYMKYNIMLTVKIR